MSALDPDVHTAEDVLREALDLGPIERPTLAPTAGPRVRVKRATADPDTGGPWVAKLVGVGVGGELEQPVGRFASMPEAVRTGITAARFVAAGIPWRVAS